MIFLGTAASAFAHSFNVYANNSRGGAGQVQGTLSFTGQYAFA